MPVPSEREISHKLGFHPYQLAVIACGGSGRRANALAALLRRELPTFIVDARDSRSSQAVGVAESTMKTLLSDDLIEDPT